MWPLIVCRCGMPIADLSIIYEKMSKKIVTEYVAAKGIDESMLSIDPDSTLTYGAILDKLFIINECCRVSMMSNMNFSSYY